MAHKPSFVATLVMQVYTRINTSQWQLMPGSSRLTDIMRTNNTIVEITYNKLEMELYDPRLALLRGAISQQSAVILICMAMDRYLCMLHPARYHKHSSKKVSRSRLDYTIIGTSVYNCENANNDYVSGLVCGH
ncbi:uncharacterized protein CBL_12056 [Carabus blaptoides fortunei]